MKQNFSEIKLADCWSFPEENASRQGKYERKTKSSDDKLAVSLSSGIESSQGTWGVHLASDEEVKRASAAMTERLSNLKKSTEGFEVSQGGSKVTVSASDVLRVFEDTHVKTGKLRPVKYIIDWAYRRFAESLRANAIRLVTKQKPIENFPATVNTWPSGVEGEKLRIMANITENGQRTEGMLKMSQSDMMASALTMFEHLCKQTDIRRTFGDGTGQKLFYLCALDKKYPELKIAEGFINAVDDALVKTFSPYPTTKLSKLVNDGTKDEVKKFLAEPKSGGNAPKMATKEDISRIASQHPVELIREVANAIIANDTGKLNAYVEFKDELNAAHKAILDGQRLVFTENESPVKETKIAKQ